MATYNITINERTKAGKRLVTLLKSLNEVVSLSKVNKVTAMDEALDDKKNGRIFEAKNSADLINKCLS
jgi:hypothetical protein